MPELKKQIYQLLDTSAYNKHIQAISIHICQKSCLYQKSEYFPTLALSKSGYGSELYLSFSACLHKLPCCHQLIYHCFIYFSSDILIICIKKHIYDILNSGVNQNRTEDNHEYNCADLSKYCKINKQNTEYYA